MAEPLLEDLEDTVRRADPDRWLASRFIADLEARADVIALYAFDHVLARVPAMVSEPLMGEIRLTWWREALDEIYAGEPVRAHPVALALAEAVRRRGLDRAPLDQMIEARFGDLDAAPFADAAEAIAYADRTEGALMQAAAQALGAPAGFEPARLAGRAYGLAVMAHRRAIGGRTRLPEDLEPWQRDRSTVEVRPPPLIPAEAGTQAFYRRAALLLTKTWVPASAGMSGENISSGKTEPPSALKTLVREALNDADLVSLPVPAFPSVAYACLARRYASGAHITTFEKQLRLVWATIAGRV